jgi:hypothetical protein
MDIGKLINKILHKLTTFLLGDRLDRIVNAIARDEDDF